MNKIERHILQELVDRGVNPLAGRIESCDDHATDSVVFVWRCSSCKGVGKVDVLVSLPLSVSAYEGEPQGPVEFQEINCGDCAGQGKYSLRISNLDLFPPAPPIKEPAPIPELDRSPVTREAQPKPRARRPITTRGHERV